MWHDPETAWALVRDDVSQYPPRIFVRYSKGDVPHPREAGARPSVGIPRGQVADYRFPPEHDCRGVHVQEFRDYWEVHVDEVHPACDVFEHLRQDAPGGWVVAGAVVGGVVGALLGRGKTAFIAGATVGALFAAATRGGEEAEGRAHAE